MNGVHFEFKLPSWDRVIFWFSSEEMRTGAAFGQDRVDPTTISVLFLSYTQTAIETGVIEGMLDLRLSLTIPGSEFVKFENLPYLFGNSSLVKLDPDKQAKCEVRDNFVELLLNDLGFQKEFYQGDSLDGDWFLKVAKWERVKFSISGTALIKQKVSGQPHSVKIPFLADFAIRTYKPSLWTPG